jgi:hypothetical protein
MAAGHDQTLYEIFADTDSENDEDFEGFDDDENMEVFENRDDFFYPENWSEGRKDPLNGLIEHVQFCENTGIKVQVANNASISDYFNIFVDSEDLEEMATETNVAEQYFQKNPNLSRCSRFRKWVSTTAAEMKRYLALIFAMGLVSQSDINEYWSTDPVTSTPFFPATMSRDRLLLITSFFHLVNNDSYIPRGQPGHNPLFNLGSVYKRIVDRFFSSYTPHQYISLDEGMIPWRSHLSFVFIVRTNPSNMV